MKTNGERERIREELAEQAPTLARLQGRGDGFRAPSARLGGLADEVLKQQASYTAPPLRAHTPGLAAARRRPLYRSLAAAAAIALLLAAGWYQYDRIVQPAPSLNLAAVSDEDLANYVYNNIEDFDLALLLESGLVDEDKAPLLPSQNAAPEEDEALEEYLREAQEELDMEGLDDAAIEELF
jgi:hypothetical protein